MDMKKQKGQKSVQFRDYKKCLKASQIENKITIQERKKLMLIALKKSQNMKK